MTVKEHARTLKAARKASKYGMQNALRIAWEASRAGLPLSLGYALVEQETGSGRNVYGHDDVRNPAPKGGLVTKKNYREVYLPARKRGLGMQGVGPLQLTWYATQDKADRLGGCWKPAINIRVGFSTLAANIHAYGTRGGIRRYNGSGPAAERYATSVLERQTKWHNRLK